MDKNVRIIISFTFESINCIKVIDVANVLCLKTHKVKAIDDERLKLIHNDQWFCREIWKALVLVTVLLWIKILIYVLQRRRRCFKKACFKAQPLSFEKTSIFMSQDVYLSYEFVPWNDFAARKPFKRPLKVHQHKHNSKEIYLELLIFIRKRMVWRSDEYPGNSNGNEIMWKQNNNEVCPANKHVL